MSRAISQEEGKCKRKEEGMESEGEGGGGGKKAEGVEEGEEARRGFCSPTPPFALRKAKREKC